MQDVNGNPVVLGAEVLYAIGSHFRQGIVVKVKNAANGEDVDSVQIYNEGLKQHKIVEREGDQLIVLEQ